MRHKIKKTKMNKILSKSKYEISIDKDKLKSKDKFNISINGEIKGVTMNSKMPE